MRLGRDVVYLVFGRGGQVTTREQAAELVKAALRPAAGAVGGAAAWPTPF